jgi:hypothetical protein
VGFRKLIETEAALPQHIAESLRRSGDDLDGSRGYASESRSKGNICLQAPRHSLGLE